MSSYQVEQVELSNRRQVQEYLALPFRLYEKTPQWVPPLSFEAGLPFNRQRFSLYRYGEAAFFLARDSGGRTAARLAAIDNGNYNRFNQERTAFFYQFECVEDGAAASAVFSAAVDWARKRGLNRLVGPKGFTVLDGIGLLIQGFEYLPAFGQPYNHPYYERLLTQDVGLGASRDLVTGIMDASSQFPERIHEISQRVQARRGLVVTRYRSRAELRSLVPYLKDLYNRSLTGTSGNAPLTDEDARILADQLIWFADPRLIKIVKKGEQAVGFLFAYPDITTTIQRTRGHLLPFGWYHMLRALRTTKVVNINGAGMAEGYRGLGGTAILFSEIYKSIADSGYTCGELIQIGSDNERMQRELKDLGVRFHKVHRIYSLPI